MLKIHDFGGGARGLRAIWTCEEMGVPYTVNALNFPTDAAYRALNPLGTVPLLEDGPVKVAESVAMILYIAQKYGPTPLLPAPDDPMFGRVMQLTVFSEATFGGGLNTLMSAHFAAPAEDKQNWSVRTQTKRSDEAIAFVADMLGDQPYLAGDTLTLADIGVSMSLAMWRGALGKTLPDTLATYQDRVQARPAYQRAKTAHPRPEGR